MAGVMVMTTGMSVGVVFLIVRPARSAGLDRHPWVSDSASGTVSGTMSGAVSDTAPEAAAA
jgi:hypothetical protein